MLRLPESKQGEAIKIAKKGVPTHFKAGIILTLPSIPVFINSDTLQKTVLETLSGPVYPSQNSSIPTDNNDAFRFPTSRSADNNRQARNACQAAAKQNQKSLLLRRAMWF